jgi:hypothetical protein
VSEPTTDPADEDLDRAAIEAAAAWHESLTGEDAAVFEEFNAMP